MGLLDSTRWFDPNCRLSVIYTKTAQMAKISCRILVNYTRARHVQTESIIILWFGLIIIIIGYAEVPSEDFEVSQVSAIGMGACPG